MIDKNKIDELLSSNKEVEETSKITPIDFEEEVNSLSEESNFDKYKKLVDEEREKKQEIKDLREEKEEEEKVASQVMASDVKDNVIIDMNDLNLDIENDKILRHINLSVHQGEFVYFVGTSGAGKSSLIKLIYRERKITSGKLKVLDYEVNRLRRRKVSNLRREIGVIFQDFKLLSDKTIYENVKFTLDVTGVKENLKKNMVFDVLKQVGIYEHRNKFPDELSGGQQQRAAIARAIVDKPSILVCDEPTGNLDPENAIAIMEILKDINTNGTTILMATHDVGIVNRYQSRVILIENGKIIDETEGSYIYK